MSHALSPATMKKLSQTLTIFLLLFTTTTAALAAESSFVVNGATALDGGGLSLSISTNHTGAATDASFFISKAQPSRSLSSLQEGLSAGKLTMNAGAMSHNIVLNAAQVKKLGVAEGTTLYVAAHWPQFSHFWGANNRAAQTFQLPKLNVAPKALRKARNGRGRTSGKNRLKLRRRAPKRVR